MLHIAMRSREGVKTLRVKTHTVKMVANASGALESGDARSKVKEVSPGTSYIRRERGTRDDYFISSPMRRDDAAAAISRTRCGAARRDGETSAKPARNDFCFNLLTRYEEHKGTRPSLRGVIDSPLP